MTSHPEDAEMLEEGEGEDLETKQPEEYKETETDAAESKTTLKAEQCCFLTEDTTLNVMQTVNGKLLLALSDGGFQYLLAGARASVGVKAGRHMFEIMVVEAKSLCEPQGARAASPKPKQLVRIGLATSDASLILGTADSSESVCFESTGYFQNGRQRDKVSESFGHSQVVTLVVNLDSKSPNANTVSLFVDGKRASKPQPLPASMIGKAVFPAVTYRNVTLQVNFGPAPRRPLSFKCHSFLHASKANSEIRAPFVPKDGKYEVLLPVGLPDEGTFDWVDQFLAKNRNYTELSDRAILDWASKSSLSRSGGYGHRICNDKPEMNFGLPLMDDMSITRVIKVITKSLPRNYIIPEVKSNLLVDDRKKILNRFSNSHFVKVVNVLVGEPPADYKTWVQQATLKDKREKAELELRRKKAEAARKKAEEERRKRQEEEWRKKQEAKRKDTKNGDDEKDGEKKQDEATEGDAQQAEEEHMEKVEPQEDTDGAPDGEVHVELTEEEKKLWFRKKDTTDLTSKDLSNFYNKFTLPTKDEGFDAVKFVWANEAKTQEYLRQWVLEKKMTQRVEDLMPSDWFKHKTAEWNRILGHWKRKQQDAVRKRTYYGSRGNKEAQKKVPEKKQGEEEAEAEEEKEANGDDGNAEGQEDEGAAEEKKEEPEAMQIDAESLDPFAVEDVNDIGNGEPLFFNFTWEDWMLVGLRFELHLLLHAFRRDLDDPDRPTFSVNHLPFYYQKYYRKTLHIKNFGVEDVEGLLALVKDTVELKSSMLEAQLSEDTPLENFVRLTEDERRDRNVRIDADDEAASLNFQRQHPLSSIASAGRGPPGKGAPAPAGKGAYGSPGPRATTAPLPSKGGGATYSGGSTSNYGQQKRPYPSTPSSFPPAKTPRTAAPSYGGGNSGGSGSYSGKGSSTPTSSKGGSASRYSSSSSPGKGSYGSSSGGGGGGSSGGYSAYSRR